MRVLLINGSPHEHGCTRAALDEIAKTLSEQGIEAEHIWLGTDPIRGCIACGGCGKTGRCAFADPVNAFLDRAEEADGFVFGTPVHYANASGALTSFMDRAFYAGARTGVFHLKPAAAIASARRAGTTATLDQVNKYFTISQMPVISSCYWNMVHGQKAEDVQQDLEGLDIMRTLGRNMAWFLRCKEAGEAAGVEMPKREARAATNFIR